MMKVTKRVPLTVAVFVTQLFASVFAQAAGASFEGAEIEPVKDLIGVSVGKSSSQQGDLVFAPACNDAGAYARLSVLSQFNGRLFQQVNNSDTASCPSDSAAGDINGDGITDLVVNSFDGQGPLGFAVHFGKSDGSFTLKDYRGTPNVFGKSVKLGDLDGDGFDDVVLPLNCLDWQDCEDYKIRGVKIYFGPDLSKSFYSPIENFSNFTVGDLDADFSDDLVVRGSAANEIFAYTRFKSSADAPDKSEFRKSSALTTFLQK